MLIYLFEFPVFLLLSGRGKRLLLLSVCLWAVFCGILCIFHKGRQNPDRKIRYPVLSIMICLFCALKFILTWSDSVWFTMISERLGIPAEQCSILVTLILSASAFFGVDYLLKLIADADTKIQRLLLILWILLLIAICTEAMELSPVWTSKTATKSGNIRNEYQKLSESFYHGHLYIEDEVSEVLLQMENPYDYKERKKQQVAFLWDHAYYKGHYYMYFGAVPVVLLFLPYRIITGHSLMDYQGTQVFTALCIIGIFVLFRFLRKKFFSKMNDSVYVCLGTAAAASSVWYFVTAPAMYCTAISSAVCMIIWSLYFCTRSVFDNLLFRKRIRFFTYGTLLGALSFGCRPPVALANIVIVPLFVMLVRKYIHSRDKIPGLLIPVLPYLIIGCLLMYYNYARFDDPFEFGQSYQLTSFDQHNMNLFDSLGFAKIYSGIVSMLFAAEGMTDVFPFIKFGGAFAEFPIFLLGFGMLLFSEKMRKGVYRKPILWAAAFLSAAVFLIITADVAMSPVILERYQSDIVFIMGITVFLIIGLAYSQNDTDGCDRWMDNMVIVFSSLTLLASVLLFFVPYDYNFAEYYPEKLEQLQRVFSFIK